MVRFPFCPLVRSLIRVMVLAGLALAASTTWAARNILVFGDSLSAGYGIPQDAAWPSLLAKRLEQNRLDYSVTNASISGETTSGGRTRLAAALDKAQPAVVVIALGANDGLRGLPVKTMRDNLAAMAEAAQKKNARVLIVGQRLPPNYGPYATQFHEAFAAVAKEKKTALVDFLLDGVATRPELFQADNLHPTAEAQPMLLDTVWQGLAPLLK
jgi:acyl-CoA thioesterase-1